MFSIFPFLSLSRCAVYSSPLSSPSINPSIHPTSHYCFIIESKSVRVFFPQSEQGKALISSIPRFVHRNPIELSLRSLDRIRWRLFFLSIYLHINPIVHLCLISKVTFFFTIKSLSVSDAVCFRILRWLIDSLPQIWGEKTHSLFLHHSKIHLLSFLYSNYKDPKLMLLFIVQLKNLVDFIKIKVWWGL